MNQIREAFEGFLQATGLDVPTLVITIITTAVSISLLTRLVSGTSTGKVGGLGQATSPPLLPYWFPYLGHFIPFVYDQESVLKDARKSSPAGVFALRLASKRHNFIYSPILIKTLLAQDESSISEEPYRVKLMKNAFGLSAKEASLYQAIIPQLDAAILPHLRLSEVSKETLRETMTHLEGNLPDLITFNPSMVDQEPWERLAYLEPTEDEEGVKASLLPLVFLFMTHMTTDSLITQSILSDSDHHEIAPLLLSFIQSFQLLLTGLPRTIPHPSLPSAHITRRKLLSHLSTLTEEVLEDAEMQGPLLEARQAILDEDQVPQNVRTADLLALLWSVNMPHVLAFWMLAHIISDPNVLADIRAETSKYATAVQEQAIMGFSVPPRVSIDAKGLLTQCPLLKSAYIETVRLYSRGSRAGIVTKDFELESQEATKVFKSGEKWAFKKGEWVDLSNWLSNTDPSNFADAGKWNAACHIVEDGNGVKSAEWGNVLKDFGVVGSEDVKDQCEMMCLSFIAGTLALWDFEPAGTKGWVIPKAQFAVGVALPSGDFRAIIKKRDLSKKDK
ncbi:hypothetical protein BLS_003431 [Venturia inaequalis]|uniref:Cytochrome P450 n=1 Tax=Venturia inaequalis TaxID=5025 RepID=A0A8H3US75_VENIN|nr:hypothetical protein EG327_010786 [Venturia inaequalis]KAE9969285.1 hypothetical protein EG328_006964 [Venturia inaequalis]KAE9973789.1 hypothetical protein BLS_003431 [Venturia inaequalis]RDI79794.1 putative glutamate carboxypeptidase [Venturia inaequalis]